MQVPSTARSRSRSRSRSARSDWAAQLFLTISTSEQHRTQCEKRQTHKVQTDTFEDTPPFRCCHPASRCVSVVLGNHRIQLLLSLTCWIILVTSGRDFIQILLKLHEMPFLSRRGWGLGQLVFPLIFFRLAVHNLSVRRGRAQTDGGSPIWRSGHGSGWCHSYTLNTVVRRRRVSHKPCGLQGED